MAGTIHKATGMQKPAQQNLGSTAISTSAPTLSHSAWSSPAKETVNITYHQTQTPTNSLPVHIASSPPSSVQTTEWGISFLKKTYTTAPLKYLNPTAEPKPGVAVTDLVVNDLARVKDEWRNTIVGFYIGNRPFFGAVRDSLIKDWRTHEEIDFERLHKDFF